MQVSDHFFLFFFFPLFILLYLLLRTRPFFSNLLIIVSSLLFYASFGLQNLYILVLPLIVDYFLAIGIDHSKNQKTRRRLLTIGIIFNLLLLGYFKYENFLLKNLLLLFPGLKALVLLQKDILLPIGISFITFQRISYLIDTFRRKIKPTKNIIHYSVYATLYPHLISGPIVRFSDINKQLAKRTINSEVIFQASKFFALGLALKVFVADQLFLVEEALTANLHLLDTGLALIFMFYFSFRIYFDFLGYSLMAMGLAKFMGFDFPANFNSPYQSSSITQFWRRWNITLSSWLRDYLYIPLGGNRKGKLVTYLNLFITMLLAGLWHGANWNFVLWGALFGVLLIIERAFSSKFTIKPPQILQILYTFLIVSFSWLIFRLSTLADVSIVLSSLVKFTFNPFSRHIANILIATVPAIIVAVIWAFFLHERQIPSIKLNVKNATIICVLFVAAVGFSLIRRSVPFIYFQF
ncbi:hypothetical protein A2631_02860 [Candidatus Daviesbacteria bacterium RIFCSPHIGHO2_01_FULL_44_29]|uniref:Alginate O-acetyltransferase n=1 Tax=Candidatus Daviesbacteria bacterium RIFCSPHIGHO2_02_FULL_43_12 TaxID=1797776 RepID=A0A1F5KKC2_9BACT|nr:MAG: hypothetical protein A2631_02860 [Candidatus Daviesbacteria bacterium RIFCSPHIGHO2_01_FULL_44_29]OGE40823.1 MAG: hypothetical protein A3E86_02490 [Candidatus Daviesbacteria bacterium RIFCSPHIGHO2_12_FULL_47_45]OGE41324.1 MAG: hypothetical protein A3D25_02255 [Candidatus Daviesbacteria bacterium RIFCSPHIGHO2_02_FULL_43_12]OGE69525.1 MAG: hypothetical protein A3B55_03995 [Candidatus Daviesbacteria bacterium RIFCSPLOWO2_01_FULL_43_15]